MSVPEEIRKVKRPVNTVVVDSGSKGLKRYAVRKRKGLWKKSVSLLIRPQERGRKFCRYET